MAEGTLTPNVVATVTLSQRVYDVTVTADGGDIWVTSDGSTPGLGHPSARRVVNGDSDTIQVDAPADPTVIKLFSKAAAGYTVTEGRSPAAASAGGGGVSIPESDTAPDSPEVGDLWLDTGTDAEQSGASVADSRLSTSSTGIADMTSGEAQTLPWDGVATVVGEGASIDSEDPTLIVLAEGVWWVSVWAEFIAPATAGVLSAGAISDGGFPATAPAGSSVLDGSYVGMQLSTLVQVTGDPISIHFNVKPNANADCDGAGLDVKRIA